MTRPVEPPEPARVLVVDDDDSVRTLVVRALRRADFVVDEATDGRMALERIEAGNIGLVVLDIGLPELSGLEVLLALRSQPDTATLPVILMTGSGDDQSVIEGLGSGADDFLQKPVRLDELIARVRAQMRSQEAWSGMLADELQARRRVVLALEALHLSSEPEAAAEAVVTELVNGTASDFVGVLQLDQDGRLVELATYNRLDGIRRGGSTLPSNTAEGLIAHARQGPWIDDLEGGDDLERTPAFSLADLGTIAGAPIFAGGDLVGLLSIGLARAGQVASRAQHAHLLAAAIDYASVLSAVAGSSIADRRDAGATRIKLKRLLANREFQPVFQPIVELESGKKVGFEALTRFDDGTPPEIRFAEATRAGLGSEYELAAIRAALAQSDGLASGAFLSLNVSPEVLLASGPHLHDLLKLTTRALVIELTEHVPISDYGALNAAVARLGDVQISVDDAGAGYASMRHILELRPAFAKLDISLVRGIDADPARRALAAGLEYFALQTGCRLIAEGIETKAEAASLLALGIDFGQGYLFGKPAPVAG
jgi:EAL domain-containing protein (putative c-di-GMP-specific phosphodiesterase class I)/DNA-binding response OmpR family regulator